MMKTKIHEAPEFQVIKMDEANAKFFVASYDGTTGSNGVPGETGGSKYVNTYFKSDANGWF